MSKPKPVPDQPRWRLILNGKSAGDELLRAAVATMREQGIALSVRVTWEDGDAERYVAEAIADGVDTVIAAGGDGTLSEVATTLAQRDEDADTLPSLALVPMGTANDFASAAQIPVEPDAALGLVRTATAQPIDLLRIDSQHDIHWCANLASGGFGTQVTVETDEGLKKMLGGLAYMITGIAKLGRIDPIQARISATTATGEAFEWQGGFIALGIGNGRQAGGGQALCPGAVIDDDLLDLTIVPELEGEVAGTLGTLVADGKDAALERVAVRRQLPWVEIEAPEPLTLNLDGEPVQSTRFHIDCVARRVRMHLPPGCPLLRPPANPLPAEDAAPEPPPGLVIA
ncbi:lipid kinase YegS [Novilysobacter erysipheiresistens]|uniref:Probable lipid kinase YegS-like n=1 Tax=Novilysobacter erysipheiresistens TaxID=1749332 RepID=A0ABU7YZ00_9GAMM